LQEVVAAAQTDGKIDDSIKFYLTDTGPQRQVLQRDAISNKKIVSYYRKVEYRRKTDYECHAGTAVTGVTLRGDLSRSSPTRYAQPCMFFSIKSASAAIQRGQSFNAGM